MFLATAIHNLNFNRLKTSKLPIFVKFWTKHLQISMFKQSFHSQYQWFDRQKKTNKPFNRQIIQC